MADTAIQRYWRQVRQIAQRERVSIREARRVWRDRRVREADARARSGAAASLRVQQRAQAIVNTVVAPVLRLVVKQSETPRVCPYCRDEFGEAVQVQCERCKTAYHAECGVEARVCSIVGCRRPLPTPARPPVESTAVAPVVVEPDRSEPPSEPVHPYLEEEIILDELATERDRTSDRTLDTIFITIIGVFVVFGMFLLWWKW